MLEMKISITAPDLAAAIVSLANALEGKGQTTPATSQPKQAADSVAQTVAPVANPAPVAPTGVPLSATPAQTVAPVANPAPVAPVVPVAPIAAPAAPVVPTSAPGYTLEMIAAAGSSLIDAGKLDALMALLGKYGVDSLTNLAPEHYGAIAMELRALGARL